MADEKTDTITKIINSNNIKQGSSIAGGTIKGTYSRKDTKINHVPSIDRVNDKKKNKFNNSDNYSS